MRYKSFIHQNRNFGKISYNTNFYFVFIGTTSLKHLKENLDARNIILTPEEVQEINNIFTPENIAGDRYAHMAMTFHGN